MNNSGIIIIPFIYRKSIYFGDPQWCRAISGDWQWTRAAAPILQRVTGVEVGADEALLRVDHVISPIHSAGIRTFDHGLCVFAQFAVKLQQRGVHPLPHTQHPHLATHTLPRSPLPGRPGRDRARARRVPVPQASRVRPQWQMRGPCAPRHRCTDLDSGSSKIRIVFTPQLLRVPYSGTSHVPEIRSARPRDGVCKLSHTAAIHAMPNSAALDTSIVPNALIDNLGAIIMEGTGTITTDQTTTFRMNKRTRPAGAPAAVLKSA